MDELAGGEPSMPRGMPKEAQKLWKAIVPRLIGSKVAAAIDESQLQAMCRAWASYQRLQDRVEKEESYDVESDNTQWRLEKRARSAWNQFDSIARRFGLTPSDRAKLRSLPAEDAGATPANPLALLGISQN